MNVVKSFLRHNPEFSANLRENSEDQLINALSQKFVERDGHLVNMQTNLAVDIGEAIKTNARPFLKSWGNGRYISKYRDARNDTQKTLQEAETKKLLTDWIDKRGYKFVSQDAPRVWTDTIAKNMLYESDGQGGFNLAVMLNGVKVKSYKPDDLFNMGLAQYVDREKSELSELRLNARLRKEALEISGMSAEDLKDPIKSESFKRYEGLLRKEYFGQLSVNKKAPEVPMGDFAKDLRKEGAHHSGLPLDESAWTLQEKTSMQAYADNRIKEADTNALAAYKNYTAQRPPSFYQKVYEGHSGLDYEVNK